MCKKAFNGEKTRLLKIRNSSRPIERFFLAIKIGDNPENSQFCKLVMEWIEEFEILIS